jgi:hypothetical protein
MTTAVVTVVVDAKTVGTVVVDAATVGTVVVVAASEVHPAETITRTIKAQAVIDGLQVSHRLLVILRMLAGMLGLLWRQVNTAWYLDPLTSARG